MSEEKNKGTEAEADKKVYEIGFQIVPSVPEDKLGAQFASLKEIIEKNGGSFISEETPKLKPLAYSMRKEIAGKYQKYNTAYFGSVKFEVIPEGALKIAEAFKTNASILRYLLIKTVRENTMTVPRIPFYRKTEAPKFDSKKDEKPVEKTPVSEVELDKAIDAAIAE
jgi:ribosomal protein S6